jgi:hypothetical protein
MVLIFLDAISSLPHGVARLAERLLAAKPTSA